MKHNKAKRNEPKYALVMQSSIVKLIAFFFFPQIGKTPVDMYTQIERKQWKVDNKGLKEGKYWRSEENRYMDTEKRYRKADSFDQYTKKTSKYGHKSKYLDVYRRVRCSDYNWISVFHYSVTVLYHSNEITWYKCHYLNVLTWVLNPNLFISWEQGQQFIIKKTCWMKFFFTES